MKTVTNPKEYDKKVPTNIRIDAELKALALDESARCGVTIAKIVNEALAQRYNVREKGENTDDVISHT